MLCNLGQDVRSCEVDLPQIGTELFITFLKPFTNNVCKKRCREHEPVVGEQKCNDHAPCTQHCLGRWHMNGWTQGFPTGHCLEHHRPYTDLFTSHRKFWGNLITKIIDSNIPSHLHDVKEYEIIGPDNLSFHQGQISNLFKLLVTFHPA